MSKAVYAGSFDPVTYGHLDIVGRAAEVFDQVIVATTDNVNKAPLFSLEERLGLLKATLTGIRGVEVAGFSGLLVDYAKQIGASVLVRGLRAAADFDYEFEMALMNRELAPGIESVFFVTRPQYMFVSSSLIREVAVKGGDVSPFVPAGVQDAIISKLSRRDSSA